MNAGVGIVAPAAAFGLGSGILPPGFLKLSATCRRESLLKSARSATDGFLHVAIGPLFHEGCPFGHYFQRKLLSELLSIPWCLMGAKHNYQT